MGARKTSAAKMFVGGNGWLQDLTDFVAGFNVNGSVNIQRITVLESEGVEALALSVQHVINVPTMFYGAATASLELHQPDEVNYVAAFDDADGVSYFGQAGWAGLPIQGPTDNVIAHAVDIIQTEKWAYAEGDVAAIPFTFDENTTSADFGSPFVAGRRLFLIVDTYDPSSAVTITLPDSGTTQSVSAPGIWEIDASVIIVDVSLPTISIPTALASGEFISGYVCVGEYFRVDD